MKIFLYSLAIIPSKFREIDRSANVLHLSFLMGCQKVISYPDLHGHTEGRSGKVRFQACSLPARPETRAFLSPRMFVHSVVIMGDFAEKTWIREYS